MEIPLLKDVVLILGFSVLIILLFQRLKVPAILGFLATGMVLGPSGFSLVHAHEEVEMLAEIGIIFLLFIIGIEFSLKNLRAIRKSVLLGGSLQVGGTILLTTLLCLGLDMRWEQALFLGFLFSLSSTAIILRLYQEKGEISTPHGRITIAILIFQDIIVVAMILLTPVIAGDSGNVVQMLVIMLLKITAILLLIFLMARYIVPFVLGRVVATRSSELFILTILFICLVTAWITSTAGLSLALGAFFAGLIISESDYSHQATANILPFREIFISFFFVSIGMLLDLSFVFEHLPVILLLTMVVIIGKTLIVAMTVSILGYPLRTIIFTSLTLFQVGEFAFILAAEGIRYKLLPDDIYQYFLAVSVFSMAVTPLVFNLIPAIAERFGRRFKIPQVEDEGLADEELKDHLVIIGYGVNGKNLGRVARSVDIPYVIIELNPGTVREEQREGEPIIYGDASQEVILKHVHAPQARVIVIAISDQEATKKIVAQVRQLSKSAYIIVRARYMKEIDELQKLGANEVIPEEFETSIEIFAKVLRNYLVPQDKIEDFVQKTRSQNYKLLRNPGLLSARSEAAGLEIPDAAIVALRVEQEDNEVVGKTLAESHIRDKFGVNILAIKREDEFITGISPQERIRQDDVLYIFGSSSGISDFREVLEI